MKINGVELRIFVGSKIKEHRIKNGFTQKTLGEKLGVKHNTISSYENGTNEPELNILFKLAYEFDISIDDFFPSIESMVASMAAEKSPVYNVRKEHRYNYFPTAISAGLPFEVDGITESEKISIPNELMGRWSGNKDVFLAKIYGDSMDKIIPDGSLIAIKPIELETIKDNDIVVFSDNHEYSVKHFHKSGDKLIFKPNSHNADHHEQHYSVNDNIKIHGKVVMWTVTTD